MHDEKKLHEMEEITIANTSVMGFAKDDMMGLLKMLIPAGTVLLIAAGAFKNNYAASGKFFGLEFNLSPHN